MSPAAILVCMTLVTNVDHGSVVTRDCHYEQQVSEITTSSIAPEASVNTHQTPNLSVVPKKPRVAEARPTKPVAKKKFLRTAKVKHRAIVRQVKPVMTAEKAKEFRFSWFKRLLALQ